LFTVGEADAADFVFDAKGINDLSDPDKAYRLTAEDFLRLNPNTLTLPTFRSRRDAELTKQIYRRVPVLLRDARDDAPAENPWGIRFQAMFHMANDSELFADADGDDRLPLYEAKLIHQFDHRWATYAPEPGREDNAAGRTPIKARDATLAEKRDPGFTIQPRYWVQRREVSLRTADLHPDLLKALRDGNRGLILQALAVELFRDWVQRQGLTTGEAIAARLYPTWLAFIERYPVAAELAPTQLGCCGDNPACFEPLGDDYVPAAPVGQIEHTERRQTAWYQADPETTGALYSAPPRLPFQPEPDLQLRTASELLDFAERCLEAATPKWFLGWRDICRATDERTTIIASLHAALQP
jgi:hypothetical protein